MLFYATFIQSLISLLSAGAGALIAISIGVSHRQLCALISFAAGTLFAITFFHIVPEALETFPLPVIAVTLASGYLFFYLISRYVFHVCPACAASHFDEQAASKFKSIAVLLAIALTIHSAMDGMAIAFGNELGETSGRLIFMTVAIHKLPEGLALCAMLLRAGYERFRSLLLTLLFETSTLVGWASGLILMKGFEAGHWLNLVLIHIGGGFIYLAFHAVLNEAREHSPRLVIFFFLIGIGVIALSRSVGTLP